MTELMQHNRTIPEGIIRDLNPYTVNVVNGIWILRPVVVPFDLRDRVVFLSVKINVIVYLNDIEPCLDHNTLLCERVECQREHPP